MDAGEGVRVLRMREEVLHAVFYLGGYELVEGNREKRHANRQQLQVRLWNDHFVVVYDSCPTLFNFESLINCPSSCQSFLSFAHRVTANFKAKDENQRRICD